MRYQGENNSFKIPFWKYALRKVGSEKCDWGEFVCSGNRSHQPFPAHHQARDYKQCHIVRGAAHFGFPEKKLGFCHKLAFIGPRLDLALSIAHSVS